ncbi:MAG: sigma-70 family RNA polymerase sigma factor [Phycisphaerales bacterium]|nr:sigma-70 family RNA polymerase sigma factor [Phycisphaerales bacterium]
MSNPSPSDVTRVLDRVVAGDRAAAADLLPMVYAELRALAEARMRRTPPGQTLQPTALVHEAYLRVVRGADAAWEGRKHFFFAAARAMRDILVEQARRRQSLKRGGDRQREALDMVDVVFEEPQEDVLALNEALTRLEQENPEAAQLVLLRYYAGLTGKETADVLGVSLSMVDRRWRFARAWLRRALEGDAGQEGASDRG